MTAPSFGLTVTRPNDEPLPVIGADFSKIGICTTSNDADNSVFPLNEPIRFNSTDTAFTSKLGTGYLADAVRGINDQLGPLNVSADLIAVRVAEVTTGTTQQKLDGTLNNIIGSSGSQTGLWALRAAGSEVNATPRIWLTPGWDTQESTPGNANPVIAALPAHLAACFAVSPFNVDPTSQTTSINQREYYGSDRLIPIGVAASVFENSSTVTRPMSPRIAGIMARVDNDHGGKPFYPAANQQVYGIVGTSRNIPFSLGDGAIEGQTMLAADVGVVVRGETGVDGAIADGGFVYIGTESCATSDLWSQFHQVRGSDYLTVKMMKIARQFLGSLVTADMVEAWINSIRFMLRDHKAANDILGYELEFTKATNSAEEVRLGHLTVSPHIEPAPVFRVANHIVRRHRPSVDALVADIISRLNAQNIG